MKQTKPITGKFFNVTQFKGDSSPYEHCLAFGKRQATKQAKTYAYYQDCVLSAIVPATMIWDEAMRSWTWRS